MKKMLASILVTALLLSGCLKTQNIDQRYNVNSTNSVADWKGSATHHFHVGSFQVQGYVLTNPKGIIRGGRFTIPIVSIKNFDLPENEREQLLSHLKTADFLNMALHPNATFWITRIDDYYGQAGDEIANKLVTGDFNMAGETHMIQFPAKIDYIADSLKLHAEFKINRAKWGMTKYTDPAAADYILPEADITLKVAAGIK